MSNVTPVLSVPAAARSGGSSRRADASLPVAIVTGAASGIGKHWAGVLRDHGFRLALADINEDGLRSAFNENDDVRLHALDVRSVPGWQRMADDTVARFGVIDYLFNIAGGGRPGFLLDVPMELVDTTIDVNLKGQIYGIKIVGPIMVKQRSGHIVNMSSLAGISPTPGNELYSAAKCGLRSVSISTAVRLRANCVFMTVICPDLVDTPTLQRHLKMDPDDVALIHSGPGALSVHQVEAALWDAMKERSLEIALPRSRGWLVKINNLFPPIMLRIYGPLMRKGLRRIARLRREQLLQS
jgi:3-oxoacyl-[acyl-carrier protein] reductase